MFVENIKSDFYGLISSEVIVFFDHLFSIKLFNSRYFKSNVKVSYVTWFSVFAPKLGTFKQF